MDVERELARRDPAVLTGVVRQIVAEPSANIGRWSVERLLDGGGSGAEIARLSGATGGGGRWSVIVKVISAGGDARRFWEECWRNEIDAYESGFLALHHGVTAPRCFLVERDAEGTWLWLEDLGGMECSPSDTGAWIEVARRLGNFNAADLAGLIELESGRENAPRRTKRWFPPTGSCGC
jgi:hypothetical protein